MSTTTSTHDAWGAGDPHLRITRGDDRSIFALTADEVRIGSAADCELRLTDADPIHATITHDERDEYVLTMHGAGETNAASLGENGERTEILRTGARFTIGDWQLVFARAESADHGRPYGGRQGGEFADQRLQPRRPDYGEHAHRPVGDRSSTTARLAGDEQGATAPDVDGDAAEPWS